MRRSFLLGVADGGGGADDACGGGGGGGMTILSFSSLPVEEEFEFIDK